MAKTAILESQHFTLRELTQGVYACIHKPGGAAYSNAGIVDLGDQTLVVDAFDTLAAGRDLRQTAEALFGRPVDWLVLTHTHSDHWIGASAFDEATVMLATPKTRQMTQVWGKGLVKDFKKPGAWEKELRKMEAQLQTEVDERMRVSLEKSIERTRYTMAEMSAFKPRYADRAFEDSVEFQGSSRRVEFRSLGRGHSEDDAVLLLPQEKVAFIGDIGFFDTQPYLGFCQIEGYRKQIDFFLKAGFQVLVPGHGPIGSAEVDLQLQLDYMDTLEKLVGEVVESGGAVKDALRVDLPDPFDRWLIGGLNRFEANVRYFYKYLGGKKE